MAAPDQDDSFSLPGVLADLDDHAVDSNDESVQQARATAQDEAEPMAAASNTAATNDVSDATVSNAADIKSRDMTSPPAPDEMMPTPPPEPPPKLHTPPPPLTAELSADPQAPVDSSGAVNGGDVLFTMPSDMLQRHIEAYVSAQEHLLDGLIRECFAAGVQASAAATGTSGRERDLPCSRLQVPISNLEKRGADLSPNIRSSFHSAVPNVCLDALQPVPEARRKNSSFAYNQGRLVFVQTESSQQKVEQAKKAKAQKGRKERRLVKRRTPYEEFGLKCFQLLSSWHTRCPPIEEPKASASRFTYVVTNDYFHLLCVCVIILDAVFTAHTLNYAMQSGQERQTPSMQIVNVCILAYYILELVLKLTVFRCRAFFFGRDAKWNWFDTSLVVQGFTSMMVDHIVAMTGTEYDGALNITFIRLLRLLKMAKIFRLFRVIQFLRELRVMLVTIANSLTVLFWAFVTLGIILYMFSLVFVQAMSGYIIDSQVELDTARHDLIKLYFGSVQASALTLYQCSSNGVDWIVVYDLVQLTGWFYASVFIFFIGFFNFAVLNILTGIFLDKALHAASPDRDAMALEQRRREELLADELRELLIEMDEDESGTLSLEEFISKSSDDYVQAYLTTLGLNIQDARMFFSLLCRFSRKSELPIDEFVWRCARMKGDASSLDLQGVAYEVSLIHQDVREMCNLLGCSEIA